MGTYSRTMRGGRRRAGFARFGVRVGARPRARVRKRGWPGVVARVLGGGLGLPCALLVSLGQLHLSIALTVPSVSVPSLTVPSVSTPVVTTPKVTTPSVTTPPVTTPTVHTPTVPTVTVPRLPVSTPTVSVPKPSSVHVPTVQSTPSSPASSRSNGSSSAPTTAGTGQAASSPAGASAGGTAGTSSYGTAGAAGAYGRQADVRRGGARGSRAAAHRGPLSTKALRRLVIQSKGCLSSLAPRQTGGLVLRTGIGLKHGFSRQEVARILGVSAQKEGQLEQRAVGSLNQASTHSNCAGTPGKLPAAATNALLVAARGILALSTAPAAPATSKPAARAPVSRPSHPTSHGRRTARAKTPTPSPSPSPPPSVRKADITSPPSSSLGWLWLLLLVAAGLLAVWLLTARHRSRLEGAPAATRAAPRRPKPHRPRAQFPRLPLPRPRGLELTALVGALSPLRRGTKRPAEAEPASEYEPSAEDLIPAGLAGAAAASTLRDDAHDEAQKAFNHGSMLAEHDHLEEAESAFSRADELGHPAAASHLGMLLERRGDLAGAAAAYRRGDERGDAAGAFWLGGLLARGDDLAGAESAYRRADARGHGGAAARLGMLLARRGASAG